MSPWSLSVETSSFVAWIVVLSIVVVALALLGERFLLRRAPERHALLVSALFILAVGPLLIVLGDRCRLTWLAIPLPEMSQETARQPSVSSLPEIRVDPPTEPSADVHVPAANTAPLAKPINETHDSVHEEKLASPPASRLDAFRTIVSVFALVWIVGAILSLGRLIVDGLRLQRWKKHVTPVENSDLLTVLGEACDAVGLHKRPRVYWADVRAPMTVGLRSSAILLPRLAVWKTPEPWKLALVHECAHIARRDVWFGLGQAVIHRLYWWNPLLIILHRRLDAAREDICDNWVLATEGQRRSLAGLLVEFAAHEPRAIGCMGMSGRPGALEGRVRRLLDERRDLSRTMRARGWSMQLGFVLPIVAISLFSGDRADSMVEGPNGLPSFEEGRTQGEVQTSYLLSPDGRRLAYARMVGPAGAGIVYLSLRELGGSEATLPLSLSRPLEEIAWLGKERVAYSTRGSTVYDLVSAKGQPAGQFYLPDDCEPIYKRLAPDGKSVAYCGAYRGQHGLFTVDLETHVVKHVYDVAVKSAPSWSPDASRLAIGGAAGYTDDYPLVIIDVRQGTVQELPCRGVGVSWSPTGRYLAFTTEVEKGGGWNHGIPARGSLGVWDLETSSLTVLNSPQDETPTHPELVDGSSRAVWSPDERWILYQRRRSVRTSQVDELREEVWLVKREDATHRKVLDRPARVVWLPESLSFLAISPDPEMSISPTEMGSVSRIWLDELPSLGPTPPKPHGRFCVEGYVRDQEGRPLAEAHASVARGWGTLFRTPEVLTDQSGHYEIWFSPGMYGGDGVSLQCALVSVSMKGYFDRDFGAHGNLGMSDRRVEPGQSSFVGVVYPDSPYRLDFVMSRGAQLKGFVVDPNGQPIEGVRVSLFGEKMPPGHSVLDECDTSEDGAFSFERIPTETYHFRLREGRKVKVDGPALNFDEEGPYEVVLVYEREKGTMSLSVKSRPRQ